MRVSTAGKTKTTWQLSPGGPFSTGWGLSSGSGLSVAWQWMLGYLLLVIVFGAVVRITGSGAGCGQHWPTCQGQIAPLPRSAEMLIEFSHRLTSGLSMLLLLALTVWTWRVAPAASLARRASLLSCFFLALEALIGARLVLLGLVGQNDSLPRAVVMALHLANTSLLTFFVTVTWHALRKKRAAFAESRGPSAWVGVARSSSEWRWALGAGLLLLTSAAGAVTALGDTLYPVANSSFEVARQATDHSAHFLQRVRGLHPLLAALTALFVLVVAARELGGAAIGRWTLGLVFLQVAAGLLNLLLSAPGYLQVLHLLLANLLWICWVEGWLEVSEKENPAREVSRGVSS